MKKMFFVLLGFAFFSAGAQTVDEVIQKYAANLGGLEAFNKIKSAKFTGSFTKQKNVLPMTIQVINNKAFRTDIEAIDNRIILVYNNGKAWKQDPFVGISSPTEVNSSELYDFKEQSMMAPILMDYKARGHQVEILGQEEVEGNKTYKIRLTSKGDVKATIYYIKAADYLLLKSEEDRKLRGQTVTVETWYTDLKDVNGTKLFMKRTQKIGTQELQSLIFDTAELNVTIDEKIFDMPK